MNTERLHKILIEIQKEYIQKNTLSLLQTVRDTLSNQVNQPQQPAHQQNLVAAIKELSNDLDQSIYNSFSPGWKQIIDEIGGKNLFGKELNQLIENIFNRNQITPAAALEDIQIIVAKVEEFISATNEVISGFEKLKIGKEELLPGQCEMGYSIPRNIVENKLSSLSKEVIELNFILGVISEVVDGKKEDFEVKTISSSDFLLYVIIGLQVADFLSNAIEKIINNYKTILEIKVLRNQLNGYGVPETATKEIDEHANSSMEKVIRQIASEVITQYKEGKDEGRKNELENATVIALNKLANRIDKGFNVEIRVEPLPPAVENTKADKDYDSKLSTISKIQNQSRTLEYINTTGQPILKLNEDNPKTKK